MCQVGHWFSCSSLSFRSVVTVYPSCYKMDVQLTGCRLRMRDAEAGTSPCEAVGLQKSHVISARGVWTCTVQAHWLLCCCLLHLSFLQGFVLLLHLLWYRDIKTCFQTETELDLYLNLSVAHWSPIIPFPSFPLLGITHICSWSMFPASHPQSLLLGATTFSPISLEGLTFCIPDPLTS